MAVETTVVFFGFWFRQRAGSVRAGYIWHFGGTAFGICADFARHRRAAAGFLCIVLFMWGIRICAYAERETGVSDHGGIVWDEIVAMLFVLAFVPFRWTWWLAAFVLFRLFDALKPSPVGWFDKNLHGGLGIMADDMAAAVMTLIVLRIAMLF